jgi:hypothetical protein
MSNVHALAPVSRIALCTFVCLTGFFGFTHSASAQVANGGFEANDGFHYTSWSLDGGGMVVTNQFGETPTEGSYQGFLTNDNSGTTSVYGVSGDDFKPSISASSLASDLGITTGTLNALYANTSATNGSAITQLITANAGDTLSFDWNFLTAEDPTAPTFGAAYNDDYSFFVLNGQAFGLSDSFTTSSTGTATPFPGNPSPSNADYLTETGYQTVTFTVPTTGTYTLGFGVVNGLTDPNTTGGNDIGSALLVDNVTLNGGTTVGPSTPEPSTNFQLLLGFAAIVGAILLGRKRALSK